MVPTTTSPENNGADLTELINGANTAAADAYRAASEVKADDQSSKDAAMAAAQKAAEAAQALYAAGVPEDDEESDAGKAAVNAMNAAGVAWEAASGETPTTLEAGDTYTLTILDFDTWSEFVTISAATGANTDVPVDDFGANTDTSDPIEEGTKVAVTVAPKSGVTISSAKAIGADGTETAGVAAGGTYTITLASLTQNVRIEVAAYYSYNLTVDLTGLTGGTAATGITLDTSLAEAAGGSAGDAVDVTTNKSIKKDGQPLKFKVKGTWADGTKGSVKYAFDGSEEKLEPANKEEIKNDAGEGTGYYIYTIPVDRVNSSVKVYLEEEEKKTITVKTNAKIDIEGKTGTGENPWVAIDVFAADDTNTKVFAGEKFEFRVKVNDATKASESLKAVTKKIGAAAATPLTSTGTAEGWTLYSLDVEDDTEINFETEILASQYRTLTFALDGTSDAGSATAKITKIVTKKGSDSAADQDTDAKINALIVTGTNKQLPDADLGNTIQILKATADLGDVQSVEVTVTPKAGYAIKDNAGGITGNLGAADGTTGARVATIRLEDAMTLTVGTEEAGAAAGGMFFELTKNASATHVDAPVVTEDTGKVEKAKKDDEVVANTWKIAEGEKTATFKVKVTEGYTLTDGTGAALTANKYIKSVVAGTVTNGKIEYTVTILAAALKESTTGSDVDNPTAIELKEAAIKYKARANRATGRTANNYTATAAFKATAETASPAPYSLGDNTDGTADIPWNAHSFTATITPSTGYHLNTVTYQVGTEAAKNAEMNPDGTADIEISGVKGDIVITVDSVEDYKLATMVTAADGVVTQDGTTKVYTVNTNTAYAVGVTNGSTAVPLSKVKAVLKDEDGSEIAINRETATVGGTPKIKIDLATVKTDIQGKTLSIDMLVDGTVVGTYVMNTTKALNKIEIAGFQRAAADQRADLEQKYAITTDNNTTNLTATVTSDADSLIQSATIANGMLVVKTAPNIAADLQSAAATADTPAKYEKKAVIKVTSSDNNKVSATLTVTVKPLMDGFNKAKVTLDQGEIADTLLNVNLGMDTGADLANTSTSSLQYTVTVTPDPGAGKTVPDQLLASVPSQTIAKTGASQSEQIVVAKSNVLGAGAACSYKVTAKLTYNTGTKTEETEVAEAVFTTREGSELKYENNLKLKKAKNFKGTLYTGQAIDAGLPAGGVEVADLTWTDKLAPYRMTTVTVSDDKGGITGTVKDNKVYITGVSDTAFVGKHTLTVTALADQTDAGLLHASKGTIAVNVVKGIQTITINGAPETLFKKDNKSKVTLKLTAALNGVEKEDGRYRDGSSSWDGKKNINAPKLKTLKWELVSAGTYPVPAGLTINEKTGVVTLDCKNASLSKDPKKNEFKVKATATDYAGNDATNETGAIAITDQGINVASIKIVLDKKVDSSDPASDHIVFVQDADKAVITPKFSTDVEDAQVYIVPSNVSIATGTYTNAAWTKRQVVSNAIDLSNFKIDSNNKKAAYINGSGVLKVVSMSKKANFTFTPKDGSAGKRILTINLDNVKMEGKNLALKLYQDDYGNPLFAPVSAADKAKAVSKNVTVDIPENRGITGSAILRWEVLEQETEGAKDFVEVDYLNDCKISVKNGKLVNLKYASGYTDSYIIMSKPQTVITMKSGKDVYTYTVNNKAFGIAKAPTVKVIGSLHQTGTKAEQTLTLELSNNKVPVAENTPVRVEVDWSAMNVKNEWILNDLSDTIENMDIKTDKNGKAVLTFKDYGNHGEVGSGVVSFDYAGSYKLRVTQGKLNSSKFTPVSDPATVTIKIEKPKAFTFKPQTNYTFGMMDGGVVLTGKSNENAKAGEKRFVWFEEPENDNVNGRPNNFRQIFRLVSDQDTDRLVLNEDSDFLANLLFGKKAAEVTPEEWANADLSKLDAKNLPNGKKDLTGWITYHARVSSGYYSQDSVTGTVKITVKFQAKADKAAQKYTTNGAQILNKKNSATEINVLMNGEYVSAAYAVLDSSIKKPEDAETAKLKLAGTGVTGVNAKGQIVIKVDPSDIALGKDGKDAVYTKNLKVLPTNSVYVRQLKANATSDADKAANAAIVQKYGIPVTAAVTVKAKDKAETPDPTKTAKYAVNVLSDKSDWTGVTAADDGVTKYLTAALKASIATEAKTALTTAGYPAEQTSVSVVWYEDIPTDSGSYDVEMSLMVIVNGGVNYTDVTIPVTVS